MGANYPKIIKMFEYQCLKISNNGIKRSTYFGAHS